jgi:hypothetical protein
MPVPNLNSPTKVEAKRVRVAATTTGATVLTCPSDTVLRLVSLAAVNVDGTNACDITLNVDGNAVRSTITVPADAALLLYDQNNKLHLPAGEVLSAVASADGDIVIDCSYEEIT